MSDEFNPNLDPEPELPNDEFDFVAAAALDPEHTVTVRTNGGEPRYVTVQEPTLVSEVLRLANLTWNGMLDIFTENGQIGIDATVNGGQTITILGNVKGGSVS
jgi:hypothetical protein